MHKAGYLSMPWPLTIGSGHGGDHGRRAPRVRVACSQGGLGDRVCWLLQTVCDGYSLIVIILRWSYFYLYVHCTHRYCILCSTFSLPLCLIFFSSVSFMFSLECSAREYNEYTHDELTQLQERGQRADAHDGGRSAAVPDHDASGAPDHPRALRGHHVALRR